MEEIPFKTFSGYLKQHAHEALSPEEQALFDILFPAFQGTSDAEDAYKAAKGNPLSSVLAAPFIHMKPGERRARRFSGYDLPMSRYSALCSDESGSDHQTLAHELRAYRDPINLGMVEVLDLAQGCELLIKNVSVLLEAQPALAVLVHKPLALSKKYHSLAYKKVPGLKDDPIYIYLFPYRVIHCKIERTIDLRYPEVQDWFYRMFRVPSDVCDAQIAQPIMSFSSHTTAHSRFNFKNALAPVPDSFWAMMPTLLNPDLGGGNQGDTGSTLVMIGHWMRQHGVSALLFPSARCDVSAVFQDAVLKHWQGWNLVDYRKAPLAGNSKHATTLVTSPWAWVSLPTGVRLHTVKNNLQLAGSFMVENMVNYWSKDYLSQLKALDIARSLHGQETSWNQRKTPSDGLPVRVLQIGALSMRWLRMCIEGRSTDQIDQSILELQGLALPYNMYLITGRVSELWDSVTRGAATLDKIMHSTLMVSELLFQHLKRYHVQEELDKLARIAADIELILFFLACRDRAGTNVMGGVFDTTGFLEESGSAIETAWLDEPIKAHCREFQKKSLYEVENGTSGMTDCINEGLQLHIMLYEHVRNKDNCQTQ